MALDEREMARSAELAKLPGGGICRRRVSRRAYLRALRDEGPHVAEAEGEAWWREQERRHPFIMAEGFRPEGTDSPNGHRSRWGKAGYRFVPGKGRFVWRDGGWRPAHGEPAHGGAGVREGGLPAHGGAGVREGGGA